MVRLADQRQSRFNLAVGFRSPSAFPRDELGVSLREGRDVVQSVRVRLAKAPKQEAVSHQGFDFDPLLFVRTLWRLEFASQPDTRAAALGAW